MSRPLPGHPGGGRQEAEGHNQAAEHREYISKLLFNAEYLKINFPFRFRRSIA